MWYLYKGLQFIVPVKSVYGLTRISLDGRYAEMNQSYGLLGLPTSILAISLGVHEAVGTSGPVGHS